MTGPLDGVGVVELAGMGPGPMAATMLSDMGATVVRVVRPAGDEPAHDLGLGRDHVVLDLKAGADQQELRRLLDAADVLVEGMRPGVLARLVEDDDALMRRYPTLVLAHLTGWGQTGPRRDQPGHDINYLAVTGLLHGLGPAGHRPTPPMNLLGDYAGGAAFAVIGILAALVERGRTGRGQVVDVAMADGASLLGLLQHRRMARGAWTDARGANLFDGGAPFYDTYECADGRYIAVGALEPRFFANLLAGLGIDGPWDQHDRAGWPALRAAIAAAFARRGRDEWATVFDRLEACVSPVLSLAEAPTDPANRSRGAFLPGGAGAPEPAPAPRFSRSTSGRGTGPSRRIEVEEAVGRLTTRGGATDG